MDVRQVSYFLAVVEHGGFGRAASALDVAQPTLSQAVRALERELGAHLFHRVSRGVVLSPAGRAFLGPARQLLRALALAEDSVDPGRAAAGGTLDLVTVPVLAAFPGAELVGSFRRAHPTVALRIDEPDGDDGLHVMVRDGDAELGLSHLPLPNLGLDTVELGVEELWLIFPPGGGPGDGPGGRTLPLTALEGADLVGVPPGCWHRDLVERTLRGLGVRTRLAVEAAHRESVCPWLRSCVACAPPTPRRLPLRPATRRSPGPLPRPASRRFRGAQPAPFDIRFYLYKPVLILC